MKAKLKEIKNTIECANCGKDLLKGKNNIYGYSEIVISKQCDCGLKISTDLIKLLKNDYEVRLRYNVGIKNKLYEIETDGANVNVVLFFGTLQNKTIEELEKMLLA